MPAATPPLLIAGPTASGKSDLALTLAERLDGMVVNADSQQVYAEWRVLTARPLPEAEARAPHRLYGHVPLAETYSVGRWLEDLAPVLDAARAGGRRPIIVGGTGLYFKALTEGLAEIPRTPPALRARGEALLEQMGLGPFAEAMAARDPETAAGLDLGNPRRVLRAWEVLEHTGAGLAAWRARQPAPLLALADCTAVALDPPPRVLAARAEARLAAMVSAGVLEEVRAVMALDLAADAPGLRPVGAPELMTYLRGEATRSTALEAVQTATRRYAKRQRTWIRNQMRAWPKLWEAGPERLAEQVLARDRSR